MDGRLLEALRKIAALDPEIDSLEGHNEWGEAECFHKAKHIAEDALTWIDEASPESNLDFVYHEAKQLQNCLPDPPISEGRSEAEDNENGQTLQSDR